MARFARMKSSTGVYHVMVRGNNRMPIFLDDADNERFLDTLARMKAQAEYEIYAYCLMYNHVHLLIKEAEPTIQQSMKRIGVSYAYYFNKKYDRVGHVFQGRFRSEAIEDDRYLLAAARYIHNNPVKAGISEKAVDYPWSSYHAYLAPRRGSGIVNTSVLLKIFSDNEATAVNHFVEFMATAADDIFIDINDAPESPDDTPARDKVKELDRLLAKHGYSLAEIRKLEDRKVRNAILKEIKESSSMSIRKLSRVLGVSKDIIFRA